MLPCKPQQYTRNAPCSVALKLWRHACVMQSTLTADERWTCRALKLFPAAANDRYPYLDYDNGDDRPTQCYFPGFRNNCSSVDPSSPSYDSRGLYKIPSNLNARTCQFSQSQLVQVMCFCWQCSNQFLTIGSCIATRSGVSSVLCYRPWLRWDHCPSPTLLENWLTITSLTPMPQIHRRIS